MTVLVDLSKELIGIIIIDSFYYKLFNNLIYTLAESPVNVFTRHLQEIYHYGLSLIKTHFPSNNSPEI
jgi:hypothetical protein